MTKQKNTKRALLASVLSMMLCMAMLIGSTFAWFTDSVTSGKNKIVAGNLDVELYHSNGNVTAEKVGTETMLFKNKDGENVRWEPGVMVYENFTVKNEGSLALKYKLTLNAEYNTVDGRSLADVLKVAILDEPFSGEREDAIKLDFKDTISDFEKSGNLAAGDDGKVGDTYAVVIYWEPSVNDNDYNFNNERKDLDSLYVDFGVNLVATQDTVEKDSFDEKYDKDATYPIVLPEGVTAETFEKENAVAYAGDTYYTTLESAIEAAKGVIYLNPNAELTETMTHAHVSDNVTIYGNGATLTGGGEHDLEVDTYNDKGQSGQLDRDVTINIYNLDRIAVWGQRKSDYTVNINLYNCHDIERIYISGAHGVNNISLTNCSASSFGTACKLYSNAPGEITVANCSFNTVNEPINLNNKSAGTQNIYITDCTFKDCSTEDILTESEKGYAAPIRVIASVEGAVSNLTLQNNTFVYSEGKEALNGDILTEDLRPGKETNGTVNKIDK